MVLWMLLLSIFSSYDSFIVQDTTTPNDTTYISNSDKLVSQWLLHQRINPMKYKIGSVVDTQFILVNYNINHTELVKRTEKVDHILNIVGGVTMMFGLAVVSLTPSKPYDSRNTYRPIYIMTGFSLMGIGLFQIAAF